MFNYYKQMLLNIVESILKGISSNKNAILKEFDVLEGLCIIDSLQYHQNQYISELATLICNNWEQSCQDSTMDHIEIPFNLTYTVFNF